MFIYLFLEEAKMKKILILLAVLAVTGIASAELLLNAGFESGDLTGWGAWGTVYGYLPSWYGTPSSRASQVVVNDPAAARTGDHYLKLATDNPTSWTISWGYSEVHQAGIAATAGIDYTLSAYAMTEPGTDWIPAKLKLTFFDGANNNLGANEVDRWLDPTLGWQYIEHTLIAPAGTATVRAQITNGTILWPGVAGIRFDDASLVPEPVTIALLGLGGLFLRRRKK